MLPNLPEDRSEVPDVSSGSAALHRRLRWLLGALVLVVVILALGPRVSVQPRWVEPVLTPDLEGYLATRERDVPALRPEATKGIVWANPSTPGVTAVSVVYLHGFSADRHEVEPLVTRLGQALGANVYFARLAGHGRDGDAMGEASAEDWLDDAAEAVAIGSRIGERVVLVGTSTGGTLALWTASRDEARGRVAAVALISPNLGLVDGASELILWPWGGVIARLVVGPERCFEPASPGQAQHWTECYPTRALLPMMSLVDLVRSLDAGSVTSPTFVAYSPDDRIVDEERSLAVLDRLTASDPVTLVVRGANDSEQHVIAGDIMSPEATDTVLEGILDFLEASGVPGAPSVRVGAPDSL